MEAGMREVGEADMTLHKIYGVWQVTVGGPAEQAGREAIEPGP